MARKKLTKTLRQALESGALMTAREVAAALEVSEPQVYMLVRKYRALPFLMVGRQMRFIPEDVEAYIKMERRVA
jgi:excisionase family DNA binding protein